MAKHELVFPRVIYVNVDSEGYLVAYDDLNDVPEAETTFGTYRLDDVREMKVTRTWVLGG